MANPAKEFIQISNQSEEQIHQVDLLDSCGRSIKTMDFIPADQDQKISLETLAAGIYFLKITTYDQQLIKRFIVE